MSKRESIKTTPKQIVEYWNRKVNEMDITVDWCEADKRCWRCGIETNLQRAHIIPDSLGGKDEPSNFVLLCEACHSEAPNVIDPEIMWDWLKAYNTHSLYSIRTLIAYKEYEFIYNKSFWEDVEYIVANADISYDQIDYDKIRQYLFTIGEGTSTHFGQAYLNAATFVGLMRMFLKDFASKYGVEFPVEDGE